MYEGKRQGSQRRITGTQIPRLAWNLAVQMAPPEDLGKLMAGKGAPLVDPESPLAHRVALQRLPEVLPVAVLEALRNPQDYSDPILFFDSGPRRVAFKGGPPLPLSGAWPATAAVPPPPPSPPPVPVPVPSNVDVTFTYQHPSAMGAIRAVVHFPGWEEPIPSGLVARLSQQLRDEGLSLAEACFDLHLDEQVPTLVLNLSRLGLTPGGRLHTRLKRGLPVYRADGGLHLGKSGEWFALEEYGVGAETMRDAEGPLGKRRTAARSLLRRVKQEEFEAYLEAALIVLFAWSWQRDAWALGEVAGKGSVLVRGRHVVVVDPEKFRGWVDPLRVDKDWRQKLGRRLRLLSEVETLQDSRRVTFLESVVDGFTLESESFPHRSLGAMLQQAGVGRSKEYFVEFSRLTQSKLPEFYIDRRWRTVMWGPEAYRPVLRERDIPMEDRSHFKAEFNRRNNFFILPFSLLNIARKELSNTHTRYLLIAALSEMRDPKDGYFPCYGATASGYKPSTWAMKAGLRRPLEAKRMRELVELANAIQQLHDWCGLEAAISSASINTHEAIERLKAFGNREKEPAGQLLRLYLPADLMKRFENEPADPDPAQQRLAAGEVVRRFRVAKGWSQEQLAAFVLRDRSAVSHWERGKTQVPDEILALLEGERELCSSEAM